MKLYIAYGSNMNSNVIKSTAPNSIKVLSGYLNGYDLVFRGIPDCAYLSVEEKENKSIPVVLYLINDKDEKQLDKYESYPVLYKKIIKQFKIKIGAFSIQVNAMLYQMLEAYKINLPNDNYFNTCIKAYEDLGLNTDILYSSFNDAEKIVNNRDDFGLPDVEISEQDYFDEPNFFQNKLRKRK